MRGKIDFHDGQKYIKNHEVVRMAVQTTTRETVTQH